MKIFRRIPWVLLLCLVLLAGCPESVEPPPPVTTTQETTTVPPTTEETVPTTAFIPLPMELDAAADEVLFTTEELFVISGYIDPECTVTICGEEIQPAPNGKFTYEATLEMGENKLPVEYLGETVTYTVNRFCNVQSYSNAEGRRYGAGARMYLDVFARIGSKVEVEFNGEKKESTLTVDQLGSGVWDGFEKHIIWFDMPNRPKEDLNLGAITYTVTYEGETEVFTTGDIICNAYVEKKNKDSEVTPAQDGYRNVGSGWIVEVVDVNVETFMGLNSLDRSYPYYNYLPQGTVDYGLSDYIYDPTGEQQFVLFGHVIRVGGVEHRQFQPGRLPGEGRVLSETEQETVPVRMQIFGESGDFQRAQDFRIPRVRQIDGKQRIHLTEGHEIPDVSVKPDGIDPFVLRKTRDAAEKIKIFVVDVQTVCLFGGNASRIRETIGFVGVGDAGVDVVRRDKTEIAFVFVHGELIQQFAVHGAEGFCDNRLAEREFVDVRTASADRFRHGVDAFLPGFRDVRIGAFVCEVEMLAGHVHGVGLREDGFCGCGFLL